MLSGPAPVLRCVQIWQVSSSWSSWSDCLSAICGNTANHQQPHPNVDCVCLFLEPRHNILHQRKHNHTRHAGRPCIVVSPLIALMEDQVAALTARGVKAAMLGSAQTNTEVGGWGRERCVGGCWECGCAAVGLEGGPCFHACSAPNSSTPVCCRLVVMPQPAQHSATQRVCLLLKPPVPPPLLPSPTRPLLHASSAHHILITYLSIGEA